MANIKNKSSGSSFQINIHINMSIRIINNILLFINGKL